MPRGWESLTRGPGTNGSRLRGSYEIRVLSRKRKYSILRGCLSTSTFSSFVFCLCCCRLMLLFDVDVVVVSVCRCRCQCFMTDSGRPLPLCGQNLARIKM
eukprot:Lithocolla_globosa_v1_NODE_130_length_5959_cov_143.867209.p4 type:complete len:100 gc:universal NODE_130_length_5959_cov_143.867209:5778-5479(-)